MTREEQLALLFNRYKQLKAMKDAVPESPIVANEYFARSAAVLEKVFEVIGLKKPEDDFEFKDLNQG
jgi:hypothetical protein